MADEPELPSAPAAAGAAAADASSGVRIWNFAAGDGPSVAEIWTAGLQQTVDTAGRLSRPLLGCVMDRLAKSANKLGGDISLPGANVVARWGPGAGAMGLDYCISRGSGPPRFQIEGRGSVGFRCGTIV